MNDSHPPAPPPLRVLHIWYADYPWDVRVEKVNAALKDAGMEVHLVARNTRSFPTRDRMDDVEIHRLRPIGLRGRISSRLNALSSFPAFVNPRWIVHIYRIARSTRPDVILVRDLPLAPLAVWVGRLRGVPVVLDMAENYPGFLRTLRDTGTLRGFDRLVRNPRLAAWVERYVVQRAQAIVCVIEESAQRLVDGGVPRKKLYVVGNTPRIGQEPVATAPRRDSDPLTVVYLGLIERHRGVQDLVKAVAESRRRGWQLRLIVIGDGKGFDELRGLAADLGVLNNGVELLGRIENRRALEIVAGADVGAIPHMPSDAWESTIPNKLFDYMSLGLPVITSNVTPVQRIVLQEACGLAYQWGDIPDLCSKLEVLRAPARRRQMGDAGRRAVQSRYNWSNDGAVLSQSLRAVSAEYLLTRK